MSDRPPAAVATRAAAFLDRDGTLVNDVHYLARPEQLHLLPGAARAVQALNAARVPVIVVTNQSGIARGLFTEADYARVEERLLAMLAGQGAGIDATYHCPHHPEITGPCACRKPGVLLYERAAAEHGLDLARSLYVGDRWRDVAPAARFGGVGVLVPSRNTPPGDVARARRDATVVPTLGDAAALFLAHRAAP